MAFRHGRAAQRAAVARACFDQPAVATAAEHVAIVTLAAVLGSRITCGRVSKRRLAAGTWRRFTKPIAPSIAQARFAAWAQGQCNFVAAHMLQATHMGLDSGPIGGFDADALATALALPAGEAPALPITPGHCSDPAPERLRKPPE